MHRKPPTERDTEVLADPVAVRLLARASELDAAFRSGAAVADLRVAATEAGISPRAFDAALAELHGAEQAPVPAETGEVTKRPRRWALAGVSGLITAGALMLILGTAVSRTVAPAIPPMVEQAFLLRCLAPGEAAELVRPLLGLRTNSVAYSPIAPRVLTVHATPEQLREVRSVLDEHEVPGSAACSRRPR